MTEAGWQTAGDPWPLLEFLQPGIDRRKTRLYAAGCCRLVFGWLVDNRSREAVAVLEAVADGEQPEYDLERAGNGAFRASGGVGGPPAWAVTHATHGRLSVFDLRQVAWEIERAFRDEGEAEAARARAAMAGLVRCIFGNPFRPVAVNPDWRTSAVLALAEGIYADRAWDRLPVLADALDDAGCTHPEVIGHLRGPGPHARGCWVVDLLLGKV